MSPKRFLLKFTALSTHFSAALEGRRSLVILPGVTLGGFWLGGELMLLIVALGLPIGVLLASAQRTSGDDTQQRANDIAGETAFELSPEAAFQCSRKSPCRSDCVLVALENGQIRPWYQPQLSTDTGQVSGFEALARWVHPERGLIAPAEFLPTLEKASAMERLSEVMLYNALCALKLWDAAGINVPQVGVNFSPQELRNPNLVKKLEWELDRFDLPASRLSVEILETVIAVSPDDIVVRNISELSKLGCRIDLDDFGTGHASISSIQRFDVQRLKIDRSFVARADRDPDQQRMIAAILTMAEQLGLATLGEGVETAGEHAMLAQLGCGHVQGFGIARPMSLHRTVDWVRAHRARLKAPPRSGHHFS